MDGILLIPESLWPISLPMPTYQLQVKQGTGSVAGLREDRRNVAKAVYPLHYGAFSSHGPTYDSTFANLTKGGVRQSSLSDSKSDLGRIKSNLSGFATEFWTNSPKSRVGEDTFEMYLWPKRGPFKRAPVYRECDVHLVYRSGYVVVAFSITQYTAIGQVAFQSGFFCTPLED